MKQMLNKLLLFIFVALTASTYAAETEEVSYFGEQLFQGQFAQETFTGFNPDYQIAAGDEISVQMWGAFEFTESLTVDAQGNIFIPQVGPIRILGVENRRLNDVLQQQVKRVFQSNVHVYANLAASQPVKVFVTGFVEKPGLYNGLSSDSILSYLDKAGGVSAGRGSYHEITLMRSGRIRQKVNLYDFLLKGEMQRIQLHDGDTVVVGPIGQTVTFSGLIENSYRIEFPQTEITLSDGLQLAGVQPQATHVRIVRNKGQVRNTEYYPLTDAHNIQLDDGDTVEVTADKKPGTITVRVEGEHDSPQEYVLPYGTRLKEVLERVSFNDRSASDSIQLLRRSVRERQKAMLEQSLNSLEASILTARSATNNEAQLRASEAELVLQWIERAKDVEPKGQIILSKQSEAGEILLENGDIINVPAKHGLVMIHGEVLFPNAVVYRDDYSLDDYIDAVGGYTQSTAVSQVIVRHQDGTFTHPNNTKPVTANGDYWWETTVSSDIKPGDEILVLPKIETKSLQVTSDITQVLYQIAVSAAVVLAL